MKAINTFTVLILMLMLVMPGTAQNDKKYTGALLWKISGKDIKEPSYILGTHHLAHVSFLDSIAGFKAAAEQTTQVAGEMLLSDMPALQAKLQAAAMMPSTDSYQKLLSTTDYETLNQNLKVYFGVGLEQLGQVKPGMISTLYALMLYQRIYPGFNPQEHEAIDSYVQRIATEKGKTVLGLETVEDQIFALFDAEPLKTQAQDLVCVTGVSVEINKEILTALDAAYRAANLSEMYRVSLNNPNDPCPTSQTHKDVILKKRNDKWLEKLPQIMKDHPTLIAVGALHLAGKEGLLYQLSKMGYRVEPVK